MILHTSLKSPYARKAQIIAQLKGLHLDCLEASADGANGYTGGANPLGKIPALITDEGGVLYDSAIVCEYLDSLKDPILPMSGSELESGLESGSGSGRWHQLRLHALGDGISDAVYHYRYETVRPEALHWQTQITRHETAILSAIKHLETCVETLGRPWEFGNIAIICALDYADFRAGHIKWRDFAPNLASWHEGFKATSLWKVTYGY